MRSGLWIASLNMPSSSIDWFVVTPTRLNIASWTWREEDVARLVLRRRHPLDRVAVEDLPNELRLRDLEEEAVFEPRVDLVRVAEPHLLFAEPRALGEAPR